MVSHPLQYFSSHFPLMLKKNNSLGAQHGPSHRQPSPVEAATSCGSLAALNRVLRAKCEQLLTLASKNVSLASSKTSITASDNKRAEYNGKSKHALKSVQSSLGCFFALLLLLLLFFSFFLFFSYFLFASFLFLFYLFFPFTFYFLFTFS